MSPRATPPCQLSRRTAASLVSVAVACAVSLSPAPAHAQAGNSAAAQGLYDDARALMSAGKAAEACPKFEESQKLDPGTGTLLNLAKCYEETGRIASAWSTYLEAASAAKVGGNVERETMARARAAALAPTVPRLTVDVAPEARVPGLAVTRDGVAVGSAQWGIAIRTDAGEHTVEATAQGRQPFHSVVVVQAGGATTRVVVPALTDAAAAAGAAVAAPAESHGSSGFSTRKILAVSAGVVGVAGLAVGTVFGLKAMSAKKDAERDCVDTTCSTDHGVTSGNDAHSAGNVATIGVIVGAVGVAAGLVLWFTAPDEHSEARVGVGLGPGSVRLMGAF